jgi:hypothetical protein
VRGPYQGRSGLVVGPESGACYMPKDCPEPDMGAEESSLYIDTHYHHCLQN